MRLIRLDNLSTPESQILFPSRRRWTNWIIFEITLVIESSARQFETQRDVILVNLIKRWLISNQSSAVHPENYSVLVFFLMCWSVSKQTAMLENDTRPLVEDIVSNY